MNDIAVVMAGGSSTRMRASAGSRHKALAVVGGMSLLERNVRQLIAAGFSKILVVVARGESELATAVDDLAPVAATSGATLEARIEEAPLGNIGFAGTLGSQVDDAVFVYVDNITTLDVRAMLHFHRTGGYDATFAVHEEALAFPWGVVEVRDGRIVAYDEKPMLRYPISSGSCVVGRLAREVIPAASRCDARDLFALVNGRGGRVGAFEHAAPWIDVNDARALERARELVAAHPAFDDAMKLP